MLDTALPIALGVFLGILAFSLLAGAVAIALLIMGLIGRNKESERRIREEAASRK